MKIYSVFIHSYISNNPLQEKHLSDVKNEAIHAMLGISLFVRHVALNSYSQSSLGACGAGPPCEACRRLRASLARRLHFSVNVARFARKII